MIRFFSIIIYYVVGIISLITGGIYLYGLVFSNLTGWQLWIIAILFVILGVVSIISAVKKRFIIRKRYVILNYIFLLIYSAIFFRTERKPNEYYVNTDVLNLRSGPSKKYKVIGKLKSDGAVFALDTLQNGWILVQADNKKGYVYGKYLSPERNMLVRWLAAGALLVFYIILWAYISPPPLLKVPFEGGLIIYRSPYPKEEDEHKYRLDVLEKGRYIQKVEGISIFPIKGWVKIRVVDELNPYNRRTPVGYITEASYEELKRENGL